MTRIFTLVLLLILSSHSTLQESCYGDTEQAISCYPIITSLSFDREITSTSTCGIDGPTEYSVRQSTTEVNCCQICDSRFDISSHQPAYLTDFDVGTESVTTWLSETGIYSPNTVNLTLSLPAKVELDALTIHFTSYKPHSYYLEKSQDGGDSYDVMKYFSVNCLGKYQLDPREAVLTDGQVVCEEITDSRPDIALYIPDQIRPIGETSPPAESDTLIDFISLTNLRIVLDGHRIFSLPTPNTLEANMSYYYEIADFSVSGRCACNGHATLCDDINIVCVCEHNTQGNNCEECAPFYQDHPWRRGKPSSPFECKRCECNSHSTSCYFNNSVFAESNNISGGVCIDCMDNTIGIHCETCADMYYVNPNSSPSDVDVCLECACNSLGTLKDVCDKSTGQCECQTNVEGRTCDTCLPGFYDLRTDDMSGCSPCDCHPFGSITTECDTVTGQCDCRDNTQSQTCNECKDGFYNIMSGTMDGCLECSCDVGGSISHNCNSDTGACMCREGITGRQCNARIDGYFVPLIDFVTIEGEEGNGSFSPKISTNGVNQEFTGTGYASLMPLNTLTFLSPISVTKSGIYQLVIRYTLLSAAAISLSLRFDVNMLNAQPDGACIQQILTPTVLTISVTPGATLQSSVDVCLNSNIDYTVTITHAGTQSNILIDSLVVIPVSVLSTLAVFNTTSSLLEEYRRECIEPRKQLSTWSSINTSFCNPITLSLSAELYKGLLQCNCYAGGSTEDNCTFDGQCSCLFGVGSNRICSQCLPGYYNLTGVGCDACGCIEDGSVSNVCNFANGQCDCLSLVDGDKCGECTFGAYNFTTGQGCDLCDCNINGSSDTQCLEAGTCICRPGVGGNKCDVCRDGYYGLGSDGCESCNCDKRGVVTESSSCDTNTGECQCKNNVEGRMCGECIYGYFSLDEDNPTGCRACYCSGRNDTVCTHATGYVEDKVTTLFNTNDSDILDGWITLDSNEEKFSGYLPRTINGLPSIATFQTVQYISAPAKFLNFKLSSYTQPIFIKLTISSTFPLDATFTCPPYSLLLRGSSLELATCAQLDLSNNNGLVSLNILLHESAGWIRTDTEAGVTEYEFLQVLANLSALFVRGSHFSGTNTNFHQVSLPTAVRSNSGVPVNWVETCACHTNYTGPSCSRCAPGYYRQPDSSCIQCNCFGDSSQLTCDPNTGECIVCPPFTTGDSCESCVQGYYGSPSEGITCVPCICPGDGSSASFSPLCELIPAAFVSANTPTGSNVECTACLVGHAGLRCEFCEDNYYGDPIQSIGCMLCDCNGNIVLDEPNNCDNISGICLECVGDTEGEHCEVCSIGFYGDAIQAKNCSECLCDQRGAENQDCNTNNGECVCRPNIEGRQCDQCTPGYFNISSSTGCQDCACNSTGAASSECDVVTGQCECKPGVTGLTCDTCQQYFYGFSLTGCTPCNCFGPGSITDQCDSQGNCSCLEGVYGAKCDRCGENFYDVTQGCIACPECYQELQENIDAFRSEIINTTIIIDEIESTHINVSFTSRLREATNQVNDLVDEATQLKAMELLDIQLTQQLEYTAHFLRDFITETATSIISLERSVNFIGSQGIATFVLVNNTEDNLLEISQYLINDPRVYLNLTQELVDILSDIRIITKQMQGIANQHQQQADQIELFITEASILSSQASYMVMHSYQHLFTMLKPAIQNLTLLLNSISTQSAPINSQAIDQLNYAMEHMSQSSQLILLAQTPNTNDGYNSTNIQSTLGRFHSQNIEISVQLNELGYNIETVSERIEVLFDNINDYSKDIIELTENDNTLRNKTLVANYKSIEARNLGNSLIQTLNETLEIIANFSEISKIVQNKTRNSLQKVSQIEATSRQAEMNASQVLGEFSIAARKSRESYDISVQAGSIAIDANAQLDIFRGNMSELSQELSQFTASFNSSLYRIQDYANKAVNQDAILDDLRDNAYKGASICVKQVQEIQNMTQTTMNEISRLYKELNDSFSILQPPKFDIEEFTNSTGILIETIANAELNNTVRLLKQKLVDQTRMRLEYVTKLSQLKEDLSDLQYIERSLPKYCNHGV
ncbi:Laminin beta/gamma [Oopsacas minuta]|uniref:Laminin beta/gamma n=1 Tax=Oopsacas minuta TaxID=111878 RepID=A0AAV7JUY9_9METZ|nr:Laminin beta/gamma [Oopsacas minuta]